MPFVQHYRGDSNLIHKLVLKWVGWMDFDFGGSGQELDRCQDISVIEIRKHLFKALTVMLKLLKRHSGFANRHLSHATLGFLWFYASELCVNVLWTCVASVFVRTCLRCTSAVRHFLIQDWKWTDERSPRPAAVQLFKLDHIPHQTCALWILHKHQTWH